MKKSKLFISAASLALTLTISASATSPVYLIKNYAESSVFDGTDTAAVTTEDKTPSITDEIVTAAIEASRRVLPDTSEYSKFGYDSGYSFGEFGTQTMLSLNWSNPETGNNAEVCVNTDGFISSFSKSYERVMDKPIPEISQSEAVKTAYEFVTTANPATAEYFDTDHAKVTYNKYNATYTVNLTANADGIVISGAGASVRMSYITGEIYSFSTSIPSKLELSDDEPMTESEVRSAFAEKLPLALKYVVKYDSETEKSYVDLVYRPDASGKLISADGDVLDIEYVYCGTNFKYAPGASAIMNDAGESEAAADSITAAEQAGIEYQSGFITPERAREILTSTTGLAFDVTGELTDSYLYKSESRFTDNASYILCVNFKSDKSRAYAEINAETGTIMSFYTYKNSDGIEPITYKKDELPYSEEAYRSAADEFIKNEYPDTYSEYVYNENSVVSLARETYSEDNTFSYTYVRHNQGLPFSRDTISVSVRVSDKAVTNVNYSYSDCEFPTVDGVITPDAALDIYLEKVGIAPKLYSAVKLENSKIYIAESDTSSALKCLFIGYEYPNAYYEIDAHTGECEEPCSDDSYFKDIAFTDITDANVSEAVSRLADMNILERTEKFEPTRTITQGEFAKMLSSVSPIPESYAKAGESTAVFGENYDPDKPLTRAMAAKSLVYARGYSEVAELTGIYVTKFSDDALIDDSVKGYIAIAQGLGLLDIPSIGEEFSPNTELTRADAALMVYNEAKSN